MRERERFLYGKDGWRRRIEVEEDDCAEGRALLCSIFRERDVDGLVGKKSEGSLCKKKNKIE